MNFNPSPFFLKKFTSYLFIAILLSLFGNAAIAQNTVSGTVYNDVDGSAKGTFTNIQTGTETGTNGNGTLNVYVVNLSDIIVANAAVASDGSYTSSSYDASINNTVYLVLDTLARNIGDNISSYYTIKMPAAWSNTSPYMTANIATGGMNLTNQNFGIQKNGFLTVPDFSVCSASDSLFTWYFRGAATNLVNGTAVVENSGTSAKIPFLKVTATYFTNNVSYINPPKIYAPSTYTVAANGGLQPIPVGLGYQNPVLEVAGASAANGVNNDSVGISVVFKNTNGNRLHIQKLNNAILDLDTYESLRAIGYNNGTEVRPVIYVSNGYGDNTTNDMRSFYTGNTAWMFDVSSGFQGTDPCNAWCDYNYNAVAIMEFPTPVDSIFYTAAITEPTGNRGYLATNVGSNELTGFKYCPVTMQGRLWDDANGNGIIDGSEANILNSGYFINMIDEYGKVLATTQILADGTYSFSNIPQLGATSAMKFQISATQGTIGSSPPATSVPAAYVSVSENQGGSVPETGAAANKEINLPLILSSNLINYNFGIEKLPDSDPKIQLLSYPRTGTIPAGTVTTSVSGTDAEDGTLSNSNKITITNLPNNATMFYNGVAVTVNQQITGFNPSLVSFTGILAGSTSVVFNYAFIDAAGQQDPTPASYTLSWFEALPISLENFTGFTKDCNSVILNWKISDGISFSSFEIERSTNGSNFKKVGSVVFNASMVNYNFSENIFDTGAYQYRLKMIDPEAQITYSPIIFVRLDCNQQRTLLIYPNPASDKINIKGLNIGERITMYNALGQIIQFREATEYQATIDMTALANGPYFIIVTNKNGEKISESKIAKIER